MPSSRERLTRIFQPAVRVMETDEQIRHQETLRYAFGQDRRLRADVVPQVSTPHIIWWMDESTITATTLMPSHYLPVAYELRTVSARIDTPPTGQAVLVHLEDPDNNEIANLSIAATDNYGITTGLQVYIEPGTWIRCQIDQIGSGTAGSNLAVHAVLYPLAAGQGSG